MLTRIPRNLLEDSGERSYFSIPGDVREDSKEYSRKFQGMLPKIPQNFRKNSGECSRRFQGMLSISN